VEHHRIFRAVSPVAPDQTLIASDLRHLELVNEGLSNLEISRALNVSRNSVHMRLVRLYDKLGLDNRVELALWWEVHRKVVQ
jgi:DNA-binding CsgD family transcriptional regulator